MKFNPYNNLKKVCREYATKVEYRRRVQMWFYPKARLTEKWSLADLYERVAAAEQLGFEVMLKSKERGLEVEYVGKLPDRPWELQ